MSYLLCLTKRCFKIDQHLARRFEYYGACLSCPSSFSMQSDDYPFSCIKDLHQSGKRVRILANCGILTLLNPPLV